MIEIIKSSEYNARAVVQVCYIPLDQLYLLEPFLHCIPKNTFDKTKLPLKTPDLLQISLDPETFISTYSDKTAFRPYKVAEISY